MQIPIDASRIFLAFIVLLISVAIAEDAAKHSIDKMNSESSFWKRSNSFWKRDTDSLLAAEQAAEESELQDEADKRAKYFLGKRAKYIQSSKRPRNNFLGKRNGILDDEDFEDMARSEMAKRPHVAFLGKRRSQFLGKRAEEFADEDSLYGADLFDEENKRKAYFLGKRDSMLEDELLDDVLKRAKYFLGKRRSQFLGR